MNRKRFAFRPSDNSPFRRHWRSLPAPTPMLLLFNSVYFRLHGFYYIINVEAKKVKFLFAYHFEKVFSEFWVFCLMAPKDVKGFLQILNHFSLNGIVFCLIL